ncbi:hypothetical protein QQ008_27265 [Fulvivirgaceae bacterium BMA10]|uniref:Uncharacterized protein n=1 Tax=Splendidivirga corallicola TaxID=3051826 RepID=A0ABT8KWF5_9BACT|nr:hypothetical protein [Fulvivirgaceae bacterium BMA10]
MELSPLIILGFQGLVFGAILVILVYLIIKRIKTKKHEDFEKRDN